MKNTILNNQVYSIEDEMNRLDLVSCKLQLLCDLIVDNRNINLDEEHALGLASILNNACQEITDVKNHLRGISI